MIPRFLADENIDPDLVLGLRRQVDGIDILRVQEVGLRTVGDPETLQWAADEGRILISHDFKTIPRFATDFPLEDSETGQRGTPVEDEPSVLPSLDRLRSPASNGVGHGR